MSFSVKNLVNLFASLTPAEKEQFKSLISDSNTINLTNSIASERTKDGLTCQHCGNHHVVRNGTKQGKQRYVCRGCGVSFMDTTNSVLASTKLDAGQIMGIFRCMTKHESIRDTAEIAEINRNTAFFWWHKILDAVALEETVLSGIVEADETFFRVSYKGNHKSDGFKMPRKAKHHGTRANQRGLSEEQVCVPCAVDRSGHAVSKIACTGRPSTKALELALGDAIEPKSTLITDKLNSYTRFAHGHGLKLVQMKPEKKVVRKIYHIQTVNSYHSGLKAFMMPFHGVSTKHLNNYLVWYRWIRLNKSAIVQKADELADCAIGYYSRTLRDELSHREPVPVLAA